MELRLLRYFWTVAETGNVSKAAEQLHVTQPTVSRQLQSLEEELGTPLFLREPNRMVLTKAGLFLKSRAEEILSLTAETEQAFVDSREELLSGTIQIGCVEADNSDTMAMLLEELVQDYPQVHFNLFTGTSEDISDRLDKGLLDVAVLLEPIDTEKYATLVLPRTERWGLLVATDAFVARQTHIVPADVTTMPLLISSRPDVQGLLADWAGVPVSQLNIVGTFNLSFNILPLVARQVASALSIEGAVSAVNKDELRFIPFAPVMRTNCVLAWRKNRTLSPATKELIDRFRQAFQQQ